MNNCLHLYIKCFTALIWVYDFRLIELIVKAETNSETTVLTKELDLNREIGSILDVQSAFHKLLSICAPGN